MMSPISVLLGTLRYEFRMQIRRPAVWITLLLIGLLCINVIFRNSQSTTYLTSIAKTMPLPTFVATWTLMINRFLPIGAGVLLADRLVRDRRTRVDELFTSMPGPLSARLAGKYLGSMLATLIPILLVYAIGIGYLIYLTGNFMALPLACVTFATIALPGILFITAFSLACPTIMWVPLYQFCFVGYWFWGNMLSPFQGIPTLSTTILTPIGGYMASGFFDMNESLIRQASVWEGVESTLLLIGIAILVMCALWGILKWQWSRQ
ncbi:MAG: hypothetical protein J2P37_06500 [Ktedonobacteraceae bacterium]|nr:hypothetical protein [Ktedonobacteraceae bacterium]